ncbi:hypothetical protein FRC00_000117 [Tulasnella sp. 408]|nr:hypothetical protein FRC00_000117 [Tulasnella sp. 408]
MTESDPTPSPNLVPTASLQDSTEGERHRDFYFCDFIDVHVEHAVSSFPSALIESSNLKDKLEKQEGSERLSLEDVSYPEVQAFLEVADARLVSGDKHFTFHQWAASLAVSSHLQIPHLRSYVVQSMKEGLNRLDPFDCIEVAEQRRVHQWLLPPFRRICERPEPLSSSEILRLGSDRASSVAKARESLMKMIHSKGLFDTIYGGSALPSSAQTALEKHALQVVKAEPLLCQLAHEQGLGAGAHTDHSETHSNNLSSSNLTEMKASITLLSLDMSLLTSSL